MLPQINVKKFQRADNLGKNPRRITYLAKDPDRGMCLIVVKEFLMISSQNFMESLHFFDSVRHPSLQKIYGYFPGDPETPPSLIFEYQTKRSVKVILKMIKHEPISQTTIMKICFGVAFALNLLHRHQPQIIHKNVNTSTVLLNEKYDPCLAGTGLYECNENPKYNAPELAKEQKYTTASDVYAYGILLKRILKASFGQNIPKMYRILISRCISANIETRPIFSEILKLLDTIEFKLPEIDEHNYAAYRSNLISTKPFDVANFKANQNIQQQQMMQQQQMHFHQAHMLMNSQHQRPHRNIDNFYPGNIQVNYPPVQNNFLPPTFAPNMMPMQMSIPMPNPNYMIQGLPLNPYSIYNDGVDINISSNYNPMNGAIPPVQYPDQIKNPMSNQFNNNLNINQMNSSISSVSSQRVNSSRIPVGLHSDPLQNNYTLSTKSGSVKGKRILMPETFVVESEGVVAAPDYDLDNEVCTPNDLDEFDNLAQPDTSCQIAIPESEIQSIDSLSRMPPVVPVTTINSQNVAFNSSQSNKNSKFDISSSSENNHHLISSSLPPDSSLSSQSLSPTQSSNFSINGNTTNKKSDVSHSLAIPGGRLLGNTILDRKRKLNGKSPDQIFEEATHNEKGDTVYLNIIRSAKLYKEAADFGNVEAQYMLGMKFLKGIGVRQDITESFKYFQKCSQNGKAAGTSRLAQISMNYFEDETNSLKYLKEALKGNDLYANFLAVKSFVDGKKWFSLEEAIVSFRFCIRREFLQFSQVFLDFAQNAPKKFIETLDEDSKKDPSALFFIGILLFKSVIDSNSLKVNHNKSFEEVLELSFLKNYRSSFEYFMNHGMNPKLPPSERQNHGCYYIIDGAKAARAGKLAEAVGLWRKASEICCWAPDRESLEMVVKAMTLGKVDKKSVIDLLTVYADNGSGSAREVFGILLIQGKVVEKNVSRGLFYLKAAYDDINYKMQDYQFLRDNCPGFYCD